MSEVRPVCRAELILFFAERDPRPHSSFDATKLWAEDVADAFVREFFGVEPRGEGEERS